MNRALNDSEPTSVTREVVPQLEAELRHTREKLKIAERIIHNLKTPALTSQIYLAKLIEGLENVPSVPDEIFEFAMKSRNQIDRISAVAEGLQRLRRTLDNRRQTVNINDFVQRVVKDSLPGEDCEAVFELCQPAPHVSIDHDGADEAITELAANA